MPKGRVARVMQPTARFGRIGGMRFSIRELIAIAAAVCIGLASAKLGGWTVRVFATVAAMATVAFLIIGIFGRSSSRAFGVGFAVSAAAYLGLHHIDIGSASALTTRCIGRFENIVQETYYTNTETGDIRPIGDPAVRIRDAVYRPLRPWAYTISPASSEIAMALHTTFALAFGYIGGKFASFIYRRNHQSHTSPSDESHARHAADGAGR